MFDGGYRQCLTIDCWAPPMIAVSHGYCDYYDLASVPVDLPHQRMFTGLPFLIISTHSEAKLKVH